MIKIKTLGNIYRTWLRDYRWKIYCNTWNNDILLINEICNQSNRSFYWVQLIRQEIRMFINIGQKVTKTEFEELCKIKGFNQIEQDYLKFILTKIGLF